MVMPWRLVQLAMVCRSSSSAQTGETAEKPDCSNSAITCAMGRLYWGALGHADGYTSEYCFTWGGDTFRLVAERDTSSGFLGEEPLFTVTNGMRVITDLYGEVVCAVNITDHPVDGVLVCGGRTYSFSLPADGVFDPRENKAQRVSL